MTTPPEPGKSITVRVDDLLSDDLAVLMRTRRDTSDETWTVTDAVRRAIELTAEIYRNTWAAGLYPDGIEPQLLGAHLVPYDVRKTPDLTP